MDVARVVKDFEHNEHDWLRLFETALQQALQMAALSGILKDACFHMLFPGGKRIRPRVLAALVHDLGGDPEVAIGPALAVEILHTATLIHDDLPAMDDDDFRRGKPTCHRAFGEASAILTGDLLFGLAINTIFHSELSLRGQALFAQDLSLTYIKLCEGQQLDLLPLEQRGELFQIHLRKTGALFGSVAVAAALVVNIEDEEALLCARVVGERFGVLFQILDDKLDVSGGTTGGRPGGSDKRNEKVTYFSESLECGERALSEARCELERALVALAAKIGKELNFLHFMKILDELLA
jgi:geranylgeranyl diphosphate synthase type II